MSSTPSAPAEALFGVLDTPGKALAYFALTTAAVTAIAHTVTGDHAGTVVGAAFLFVTYLRVWNRPDAVVVASGLGLGGLMERAPISVRRLTTAFGRAGLFALTAALLTLPAFCIGFLLLNRPAAPINLRVVWEIVSGDTPGQILVVALPEEAFYRGYLQPALEAGARARGLGALSSSWAAILVTSALFAIGHLLTMPHAPARLLVFFPSLLFGYLRVRSGGVGGSILYHAMCNICSASMYRGFGPLM